MVHPLRERHAAAPQRTISCCLTLPVHNRTASSPPGTHTPAAHPCRTCTPAAGRPTEGAGICCTRSRDSWPGELRREVGNSPAPVAVVGEVQHRRQEAGLVAACQGLHKQHRIPSAAVHLHHHLLHAL